MQKITDIVLIGAGNVATNLGVAFQEAGFNIVQVYSRSSASAKKLAKQLNTSFTTDLESLVAGAHLYILSVPDNAMEMVLQNIDAKGKFLVHTSGSLSMQIFEGNATGFGVFYPLQTFSKLHKVDFHSIPVCVEANSSENIQRLKHLANSISKNVRIIGSEQRRVLHLAAVFACNFPNFMYSIAESITQNAELDFDLLKPLIMETAEKVQFVKPSEAQTGPAFRGDTKIMEKHMEMLVDAPEILELYQLVSKKISKSKS